MELPQKQQHMKGDTDMEEKDGESVSGAEKATQKSPGSQGESKEAGGAKVASGKGTEAGTEAGGAKVSQQQQGKQQERAEESSQESKGGKGSGDSAPSQIPEGGDKTASTGEMKEKQAANNQGMSGGSMNKGKSSAALKNEIMNQMRSLSNQISDLEKKMGYDSNNDVEKGRNLKDISKLKQESVDIEEQEKSKEFEGRHSEVAVTGGTKPGEKLYSSEPEKIETPESAEKLKVKLKGIKDEFGTKRETISTGKGEPAIKRKLPTVGYDDAVKLSTQQAEDDVIKKTSIPLEYEEIIKKIHSDKE